MDPSNAQSILVLQLALGVELPLVQVPAGEFIMGEDCALDPDAWDSETPRHRVYLDSYWIGKYPVTVVQFAAFVHASGFRTQAEERRSKYNWLRPRGAGSSVDGKDGHPVTHTTWHDAVAFCDWASRHSGQAVRLPSEAQWEKAARGTDARRYPWGNDALDKSRCNFDDGIGDTTPVGHYSPHGDSPYGCVDMAGNVWEWCADWYDPAYYRRSPLRNPAGPAMGDGRVLRGGSFWFDRRFVRCASRFRYYSGYALGTGGFRVVVVCPDSSQTSEH